MRPTSRSPFPTADDAAIAQGSITGTSTPAAEDQLSFSDQPASDANIPGTPGSVGVSVLDAFGNLTASTETIDLQLVESGTTTTAAFTGTATQPAAAGTAAFSGLSVTNGGVYDFLATSSTAPGLTQARSEAFSIGDPPPALTALTPNDGNATQPVAQNIDEGATASLTFTATFDDSDRAGQPVGEGQISSVLWEVRLAGAVVDTITDTPAGPPNQHTSTFTFAAGLDRLSSDDGKHNNEETFQITATGSDQNTGTTSDAWDVTVRDTNQAPSVDGVTLTVQGGGDAFITSTFVATPGSASDADNDAVTFTYEWLVNGTLVNGETTNQLSNNGSTHFTKSQTVAVRITPTNATRDDNQDGAAVTSSAITVSNSLPTVTGGTPAADDNQTIQVDLSAGANDDDSDTLSFSIVGGPTQGNASISGSHAQLHR